MGKYDKKKNKEKIIHKEDFFSHFYYEFEVQYQIILLKAHFHSFYRLN